MADEVQQQKAQGIYNAGTEGVIDPLIKLIFFVVAIAVAGYLSYMMIVAKEFSDGEHIYKCKSGYVFDAKTKECVDRYPAMLVK